MCVFFLRVGKGVCHGSGATVQIWSWGFTIRATDTSTVWDFGPFPVPAPGATVLQPFPAAVPVPWVRVAGAQLVLAPGIRPAEALLVQAPIFLPRVGTADAQSLLVPVPAPRVRAAATRPSLLG